MSKKTILLLVITLSLIFFTIRLIFAPQKTSLTNPNLAKSGIKPEVSPSKTLKNYADPAGFSFNYPDNLSLTNNEATSSASYADITLNSKDVEGGLNIKISDSKAFTPAQASKETKLGSLKAYEKENNNKLVLEAFDQGILFKVESDKNNFWKDVYSQVIKDFSFAPPQVASADDVSFESEEVVE